MSAPAALHPTTTTITNTTTPIQSIQSYFPTTKSFVTPYHPSEMNHPHYNHLHKSSFSGVSQRPAAISHVTFSKDHATTMTPVAIRVFASSDEDHHSSASSGASSSSFDSSSSPVSQADSQILCAKSTSSSSNSSHKSHRNQKTSRASKSKSSPKPSSRLTVTSSSPPTRISKYACQKSKKKSKINIPVFELIRVMALPQTSAAQVLGVSLSTLKRRYYELGIGRWPGQIANDTKEIEKATETSPEEKVKLSFLLNGEDIDARQIDQITWSILNFTFKQSF
ncbi:hypothetical protein C9374_005491 [Naegleria lovaniensis]|uniref:RWP-RK domain-containing protein n=1 Tax=Naegleria lovaniensis TaxID=51637 RepID=A0AA88GJT6_NAELO|nr:uncharacterized protein C9374_005491 [Naegleria lovaniensis]KAG2382289.1 hypothetical protein C9374_005491 [Naegleria lovaniensis]